MATQKEATPRRRLGRGLGSLLSSLTPVEIESPQKPEKSAPAQRDLPREIDGGSAGPESESLTMQAAGGERILMIPPDQLHPSPRQPRTNFDEEGIEQLAASIRSAGLMQPVIVRPRPRTQPGGGFELIAGERRWRAAQRLALRVIPAIVRDLDDRAAAEWSLVENIQREDLNPMEQAEAFAMLVRDFGLTHQDLAERVGLNRSTISNALRLMELDDAAKDALRRGALSAGHAKALLGITNLERRRALASQAVRHAWSVRELEHRARAGAERASEATAAHGPGRDSAHLRDLQKRLSAHLATSVAIIPGRKKGSGKLIIDFYDLDQFEGLMQRLNFESQ